jgi:uncharacterized protein YueI
MSIKAKLTSQFQIITNLTKKTPFMDIEDCQQGLETDLAELEEELSRFARVKESDKEAKLRRLLILFSPKISLKKTIEFIC